MFVQWKIFMLIINKQFVIINNMLFMRSNRNLRNFAKKEKKNSWNMKRKRALQMCAVFFFPLIEVFFQNKRHQLRSKASIILTNRACFPIRFGILSTNLQFARYESFPNYLLKNMDGLLLVSLRPSKQCPLCVP